MLEMKYKETARQMAVVSQDAPQAFDFSVRDIVLMGRHPHKKLLEADTAVDHELVEQALERVGMDAQADQGFATLSGGEKQRVLIARALVPDRPNFSFWMSRRIIWISGISCKFWIWSKRYR